MFALLVFCICTVVLGDKVSAEPIACVLSRGSNPTFAKNLPLLSNRSQKIYPRTDGNGDIVIPYGSKFTASCTPANEVLETYQTNEVEAECQKEGKLVIAGTAQTSFADLACTEMIKEEINAKGICNTKSFKFTNISIEFNTETRQFPLITVCHDANTSNTIMSEHTLYGASIASAEVSNLRPNFKKSQFYPFASPQSAYAQSSQLAMMKKLVKSSDLANRYINKSLSLYFARGHLAPDGDFIYVAEQDATYYYVNVVPQWQSINNGNWKAMEMRVRSLAASTQSTFKIYTGSHKILQLNDVNKNPVEIYLAKNENGFQIPVPKFSWKIIHDQAKKLAVAIIMVNNPHQASIEPSDIICPDICHSHNITWVSWERTNIQKGYTYCCTVSSFRKAVPNAPNLGTKINVLV